jgi:hypothetical protein
VPYPSNAIGMSLAGVRKPVTLRERMRLEAREGVRG